MIVNNVNENSIDKYKEKIDGTVITIEEFFESAEQRIEVSINYYEAFFNNFDIPDWKFVW